MLSTSSSRLQLVSLFESRRVLCCSARSGGSCATQLHVAAASSEKAETKVEVARAATAVRSEQVNTRRPASARDTRRGAPCGI